jgi:uncharacterized protein
VTEGQGFTAVDRSERIHSLDVIRALALFGVLQINLFILSGTSYVRLSGRLHSLGWGGLVLERFRDMFLSGKSMSLFCLLFGIGFAIQMDRAANRSGSDCLFATRRFLVLISFGVLHAFLIWPGDILFMYGIVGLLMIPIRAWRTKSLLFLFAALFIFSNIQSLIGPKLRLPLEWQFQYWRTQFPWLIPQIDQAYLGHSWFATMRWRIWEWGHYRNSIRWYEFVQVLPLFVAGLAIWKSGLLTSLEANRRKVIFLFNLTFWPGVILNTALTLNLTAIMKWSIPMRMIFAPRTPLVAFGMFFGLLLLLQGERWRNLLEPLAPMGRMALTNYLTQTLVGAWIFNGHGLGLWGKMSGTGLFILGVGIYAAQIAFSTCWLARFRFGPLEWLWRSASYTTWQPMRLEPAAPGHP